MSAHEAPSARPSLPTRQVFQRLILFHRIMYAGSVNTANFSRMVRSVRALTFRLRIVRIVIFRCTVTVTISRLKPSSASTAIRRRISTRIFPANINPNRIAIPKNYSAERMCLRRVRFPAYRIKSLTATSSTTSTTAAKRSITARSTGWLPDASA